MTIDSSVHPIGVFDSGYGGLTILKGIREALPQYDYLYLGDNARAPYGTRSFESVYKFTLQAVKYLFEQGCPLVILACNTASAKALRSIQQNDLPGLAPENRVLGVIRPTVEALQGKTETNHIGVFATPGTIASGSYEIEIGKLFPDYVVTGHACDLWATLIENGETDTPGAEYFIERDTKKILERDEEIDSIILGCTHYPLIREKISGYLPENVRLIEQGAIVGESLSDYLVRHPEMETRLSKGASARFLTTDDEEKFDSNASLFLNEKIKSNRITLS